MSNYGNAATALDATSDPVVLRKIRMVVGPPGCGKTHYLAERVLEAVRKFGPRGVLVCSLTRTAAKEAIDRVSARLAQDGIEIDPRMVGTLHSHALRALGSPEIAETSKWVQRWNEWTWQHGHQAFALTPEAGPGVVDGLRAERRKQQTIGDQHLERYSLDRARCQVVSLSKSYNRFVELWNEWKAENDLVDFEDMITLAWERGVSPVHSPAVIYGDEAQDWSASEIRLLLSWARSARAGACLVGDGDQAIYAWRGADHHAFLGIRAPEENRKVLSQSYRVPRAVRDFALEYIRSTVAQREDVEYLARDADGFVDRYSGWAIHGQGLWRLANHLEDETRAGGRTHMILAYGNTQLATLLKELRARGVPFANRFRAANKAWNPLERVHARAFASGFARQDALGRPSWTRGEVAKWIEVVDSQHLQRGAKAYLKGLAKSQKKGDGTAERQFPPTLLYGEGEGDDTIPIWAPGVRFDPTFEWLFEHTMASALNHVAYHAVVERRFGREHLDAEPKITVGTIHSVKGGEADVVYVSPDLPYPAVADRMVDRRRADESIGRLYYVAFTRAREGLVLLEPRRRARSIELAF